MGAIAAGAGACSAEVDTKVTDLADLVADAATAGQDVAGSDGAGSDAATGGVASPPTGVLLVEQHRDDGTVEVVQVDLSSGAQTTLSAVGSSALNAAWSPDGSRIVFAEQPPGDPGVSIWTMASDGSDRRLVSATAIENSPAWSPDCTTLAFISIDMTAGEGSLILTDADGSNRRVAWTGPGVPSSPTFSPDGDRVILENRRGQGRDLTFLDLSTDTGRAFTNSDVDDAAPAWSPDGSRVVYASRDRGLMQLFVVDALGGEPDQLTSGVIESHFPVWSPDGQWIAYRRGESDLTIVAAAGGDPISVGIPGKPTDWGPKAGSCG